MDCVVSVVGYTDKELRIHQVVGCQPDVIYGDRIHMMDYDLAVYLITIHAEIQSIVSHNHKISYALPFGRPVELLIEISLEAERFFPNFAAKLEVLESLFECVEEDELRICPDLQEVHRHHPVLHSWQMPP